MKLNLDNVNNIEMLKASSIKLPQFDIDKLRTNTNENPQWLHFGGGNIFRVFIAAALQDAIENGKADTGVIVAESFDYEVLDRYYRAFDNLSLSVIMDAEGNYYKRVIASVTNTLKCNDELNRLKDIATCESLKMISFTITEKGYSIKDINGNYLKVIEHDIENGPKKALHTMSIVTMLLLERYKKGAYPLAVVSMDNCSHNGDKLGDAIKEIAVEWQKKALQMIDLLNI